MKKHFMFVLLLLLLLLCLSFRLHAVDVWNYPEAADKNTVFINAAFADVSLSSGSFAFYLPEISVDYVQPFLVPVSVGVFLKTPDPNLRHFGIRLGYHINLEVPNLDVYALYVFDLGFLRNDTLIEHNDEPVETLLYDFRAGIRYRFASFCIFIETGFKMQSINFGISLKL